MLEFSKEDSEEFLSVTWCFDGSHYFVNDHDALFDSEINCANPSVRSWSKDNGVCVGADKAHFVEYNWDVFLLEIV